LGAFFIEKWQGAKTPSENLAKLRDFLSGFKLGDHRLLMPNLTNHNFFSIVECRNPPSSPPGGPRPLTGKFRPAPCAGPGLVGFAY